MVLSLNGGRSSVSNFGSGGVSGGVIVDGFNNFLLKLSQHRRTQTDREYQLDTGPRSCKSYTYTCPSWPSGTYFLIPRRVVICSIWNIQTLFLGAALHATV
uniref:(northern house mosquito) hypothetical protein n=1 Tax=Culex pipiens TaxID=7175 RepID=A0A8D8IL92_CULPI